MASITTQELHELLTNENQDFIVVDVRTQGEWDEGHIKEAKHFVLDEIETHMNEVKEATTAYLICRSGGRSGRGCYALEQEGLTNVVNVEGGMSAWKAAGFEVEVS